MSLEGEKRNNAAAFVIDDKAYLGLGTNNGLYQLDFWEFDPVALDWIAKLDIDEDDDYSITRERAVSFSLDGYGYVTTGNGSSNLSSVWRYDPLYDLWKEKTSFEGTSRQGAVAFTVSGRAFVALGQNSSSRFDDVWEFLPNEIYDEDD